MIRAAFRPRMLPGLASWLGVALAWAMAAFQASAAEPVPAGWTFRRVFAPADRVADWPRDNVHYIPVEPDEFEALVAAQQRADNNAPRPSRIETARYQLRFEAPDTLQGTATLQVAPAEGATDVLLQPWNLAVGGAHWDGSDAPATLAVDPRGRALLRAAQPGKLVVDWAVRGTRQILGGAEFTLEFPAASQTSLTLELPDTFELIAQVGTVNSSASQQAGHRNWQIDAGGHSRLSLRIAPHDLALGNQSAEVRTQTLYELTPHGVDVTAQWRIEPGAKPVRELRTTLEAGLQIVEITLGDKPLRWTTATVAGGQSLAIIELPELIRGVHRTVRLKALGSWEIGRRWQLPRLIPEGVSWREGTASVAVPTPLVLKQLDPTGGRLVRTGVLPAPRVGETFELQLWDAAGTASLVVARERDRLHVAKLVELEISGDAQVARAISELKVAAGERFAVRADIQADWVVDDVQTKPADALLDWSLDAGVDGVRQLNLRLARALNAQQPLHVTVKARRRVASLGEQMPWSTCQVIAFADSVVDDDLFTLVTPGWGVEVQGLGQLRPVAPELLSPRQKALAEGIEFTQLWRLDPYDSPPTLNFRPRPPRLEADEHVEVRLTENRLSESYTWHCRPIESAIERLTVRFSTPRAEPPRWLVNGQSGGAFRFRRADDRPGATAPNVEAWEIVFEPPLRRDFFLQATREIASTSSTPVSLAVIEPAQNQTGVLVVRAAGSTPVMVQTRGLRDEFGQGQIPRAAPTPNHGASAANGDSDTDKQLPVRAAIRFDPVRDAAVSAEHRVVLIRPTLPSPSPGLLIWLSQLTSHYQESGLASHALQLLVRNSGADRLELKDVAEVNYLQATVEGRLVEIADRRWVPLDPARPLVNVTLRFTTSGLPLFRARELPVPRLAPKSQVLCQRWRVWLPDGFTPFECRGAAWLNRGEELTWTRRLFGPLSRPSHQGVFDPLLTETWIGALGHATPRATSRTLILQVLEQLGATIEADDSQSRPATWGQLWSNVEALPDAQHVVWLVDRQACGEMGIEPTTPLPATNSEPGELSSAERACRILQRAGLVLVTDGSNALITTATALGNVRDETAGLIDRTVFWLEPGPLQHRLAAGTANESTRYVRVALWQLDDAAAASLVRVASPSAASAGDPSCEMELTSDVAPTLIVEPRYSTTIRDWGLGLVSAGLAIALFRRWPTWTIAGMGLLVAAALVVPQNAAGFFPPVMLGAVSGVLAIWLMPRSAPAEAPQPARSAPPSKAGLEPTRTLATPGAIGAVLVIGFALLAALATAAEPAPAKREFRVFVPSDDQGKPTDGHYLVPEPLYSALTAAARTNRGAPDWTLTSAHYRATLVAGAPQRSLELHELIGVLDISILHPQTLIELPLGADGAAGVRTLLDGRAIDLHWDEKLQRASFIAPSSGDARLELFLRPVLRYFPDGTGFEFAAPATLNTTLDVWLPEPQSTISVPAAIGRGQRSADGQSTRYLLGNAPQLGLRWLDARGASLTAGPLTVDELRWLKVRPGSVVIDAQWHARAEGGAVRDVTILADSRLRPLTGTTKVDDADVVWAPIEAQATANVRAWRLTFARPVTETALIEASFLWTDVSGVGQLQMPLIELAGVKRALAWTAITVDPSMEFELHEPGAAVEPGKFVARWGDAPPPQRVVEWAANQPAWRLATRPRPVELDVQEAVSLSVDVHRTRLWYVGTLTARGGSTLDYELTCPSALQVERVTLQEDGIDRPVRWSQNGNELSLFLSEPATGVQQIAVEGSLAHSSQDSLPLPLVWLGKEARAGARVQIFRRPMVLVSIDREQDLSRVATAAKDEAPTRRGRLEASYTVTGVAPSARLIVTENQPQIAVTQLTSVSSDADGWLVDLDSRWQVSDGRLDQVQFLVDAPEDVRWTALPASKIEMAPAADGQSRRLIITPPTSIQGEFRLRLHGSIPAGSGRQVSIPNLWPLNVAKATRYLRLPNQANSKPIRWELSHWQPCKSPTGFPPVGRNEATYEALDRVTTAQLDSVHVTSTPTLYLADVHLLLSDASHYQGQVTFDLEAALDRETLLKLPANCELVQATIDGRPATLAAAGNQRWRLPLGNTTLPQRVEVTFTGQLAQRRWLTDELALAAPTIEGLDAAHTLWTVIGPRSWRMDVAASHSRGAWGMDLLRLQSLATLLNQPSERTGALEPNQRVAWYAPWHAHWLAVHSRLKRELAAAHANGNRQAAEARMAALEQELATRTIQFGATSPDQRTAAASPDAVDFWLGAVRRGHNVTRGVTTGSAGEMRLHWADATAGDALLRWSVAASLVIAVGLMARFRERWAGLALLASYSGPLVGVLAGLVWWLAMEPSWVGLAFAAASALVSARTLWRTWSGLHWRANQRYARPAAALLRGPDIG